MASESESLQQELVKLRNEKAAFQAQSRLLEEFLSLARSSAEETVMKSTLQKTLEVAAGMTGAEKGSLFLLDSQGVVTDSILTRADTTPEQRSRLIGNVLDKGLAGWVRSHRREGLIKDTATDSRWLDLPNQPYQVGSALSVPILRGDELLGILTLLHSRPGHFTSESAELMRLTAHQMGIALENAKLYTRLNDSYHSLEQAKIKIETYSQALDAELAKGKKIQRDFLPIEIPRISGWEIALCFHPARQVSGDFYDVFLLPGGSLGVVIADVCDKGVGSALFMALFRSLIRVFSGEISSRGLSITDLEGKMHLAVDVEAATHLKAVAQTNDYIANVHGQEVMFATLFFGVMDPHTGWMTYINGGHEPPLLIGGAGIKETLKNTGPAVGVLPGAKFEVRRVRIGPGETLIGYTDGVTDARSPYDALFSKVRFLSLVDRPADSANELIDRVKTDLFKHIDDAPQADDITMIAIHRAPH
jgi:sigma-B regulation protein RsbU (phosphoserine phosphatase)